jgi:AraC-like DNA-binding protein
MINIEYIECDATHNADFVFDIPQGHEHWLLLFIKTSAKFEVDGIIHVYPANSAILYKPRQKILYEANENTYVNNWIRFSADDDFIKTPHLPHGRPFSITDPITIHKVFELIQLENIFDNEYKDITIENLMRILFTKLIESYNQRISSPLHNALNALKRDIHRHPNKNWSLQMISDQLNISVGYLELVYKEAFGLSCIEDVINSRIHLAKRLLIYNHYSVAEISEKCGYNSIEHFYRQFKQITFTTPSQFRKKHLL